MNISLSWVSQPKIEVGQCWLLTKPETIHDMVRVCLGILAVPLHNHIHRARPDVVAAHAHSLYGKAWSSLGRLLDPITQDACAFFEDHVVFEDFTGVVLEMAEGERIAAAPG